MSRFTEIEQQHLECLKTFSIDAAAVVNDYKQNQNVFPWEVSLSDFIEGCLFSVAMLKSEELDGQYASLGHALKRPINHVVNYGFGQLELGESRKILDKFRILETSRAINRHTRLAIPVNWDIIYSPTRYAIYGLLETVEI
ncbi:MAG: hypothetical protein G01um10147_1138 [Microgenomates group bacterium Gr01-1014_7]|nr:MAG: hypothetical protein G01um10147_1138 [Microgenomates group bacterium Gr01-1014_7]